MTGHDVMTLLFPTQARLPGGIDGESNFSADASTRFDSQQKKTRHVSWCWLAVAEQTVVQAVVRAFE